MILNNILIIYFKHNLNEFQNTRFYIESKCIHIHTYIWKINLFGSLKFFNIFNIKTITHFFFYVRYFCWNWNHFFHSWFQFFLSASLIPNLRGTSYDVLFAEEKTLKDFRQWWYFLHFQVLEILTRFTFRKSYIM